jgi:hypothetical protein
MNITYQSKSLESFSPYNMEKWQRCTVPYAAYNAALPTPKYRNLDSAYEKRYNQNVSVCPPDDSQYKVLSLGTVRIEPSGSLVIYLKAVVYVSVSQPPGPGPVIHN